MEAIGALVGGLLLVFFVGAKAWGWVLALVAIGLFFTDVLWVALLVAIYFLPVVIAMMRELDWAFFLIIIALEVLVGWTVVVWVGTLIWASLADKETWGAGLSVRQHVRRVFG